MSTIAVHIPDSLKLHIERLARADGISVEQFLTLAAAEKLGALDAGQYLAGRAARGDRNAFLRVLAKAPVLGARAVGSPPSDASANT